MEALRSEIAEESEELPDAAFFNSLTLACTPSAFFEVMVMCIKNNGLLYQAHVKKKRKVRHNKLETELKELKANFRENVNNILERERELAAVIEKELKSELKHMKKFDRLSNEK